MADRTTLAGLLLDATFARSLLRAASAENNVNCINDTHVMIDAHSNVNMMSVADLVQIAEMVAGASPVAHNTSVGKGKGNGHGNMGHAGVGYLAVLPPMRAPGRFRVSRALINELRRIDNQYRKGLGKGPSHIRMGHAGLVREFMCINAVCNKGKSKGKGKRPVMLDDFAYVGSVQYQ